MADSLEEQVKKQNRFIKNQKAKIERLEKRINRLEALLEYSISDPQIHWLVNRCVERMDPTVPIFDPERSEFHLDRYRFAADYVENSTVADIACGTGYGSNLLKQDGKAESVTGIDIDSGAIEYARAKHSADGINYLLASGDATGLPDESVDVVVSFETIEHVPDDKKLIAEFSRILRPEGLLVISTPNQWPLEIAPHHVREYDRQSFEAVLQPDFQIESLWNQNSGSAFEFNRNQERGIIPTLESNEKNAECYLAVARKVN